MSYVEMFIVFLVTFVLVYFLIHASYHRWKWGGDRETLMVIDGIGYIMHQTAGNIRTLVSNTEPNKPHLIFLCGCGFILRPTRPALRCLDGYGKKGLRDAGCARPACGTTISNREIRELCYEHRATYKF